MSFSKAKRFVYKPPDVNSSPADYLITLRLNKGCSIPKSSRFQQTKNREEGESSPVCSRSFRICNSKTSCDTSQNKTTEESSNMVRNGSIRRSVKFSKKINPTPTSTEDTQIQHDMPRYDNTSSCDSDFIDDDYGSSSITSSDDLDHLKTLEEYEINEVYKIIKRLEENKKALVPSSKHDKDKSCKLEEVILRKLENIDKNVRCIKEDVASIPQKTYTKQVNNHRHKQLTDKNNFENNNQTNSVTNRQIRDVMIKEFKDFRNNVFTGRKYNQRYIKQRLLEIIADMYVSENKSERQTKELLFNAEAEELAQILNHTLQIHGVHEDYDNENKDIFINRLIPKVRRNLNTESGHIAMSQYLQQTMETSQELEEDLLDISHKCIGTQQMLSRYTHASYPTTKIMHYEYIIIIIIIFAVITVIAYSVGISICA